LESAVGIVAPGHTDAVDSIACLMSQDQQLHIEHVPVDARSLVESSQHVGSVEFEPALGVRIVPQAQPPSQQTSEESRTQFSIGPSLHVDCGVGEGSIADYDLGSILQMAKHLIQTADISLVIGIDETDDISMGVFDTEAHGGTLSLIALCADQS